MAYQLFHAARMDSVTSLYERLPFIAEASQCMGAIEAVVKRSSRLIKYIINAIQHPTFRCSTGMIQLTDGCTPFHVFYVTERRVYHFTRLCEEEKSPTSPPVGNQKDRNKPDVEDWSKGRYWT